MKVDRHTKTKKSIFCNLEIFRVRDKDFPVEVVEHKGQQRRSGQLDELTITRRHCFGLFVGAERRTVCHCFI